VSAAERPAILVHDLHKVYPLGNRAAAGSIRDLINDSLARGLGRADPPAKGPVHALSGVSFEVARGEVVGLIGPNGAGKTTLVKILSRITPPSSGYAELGGRVGSILDIGLGFHNDLTGRENIWLGAAMLGLSLEETRRQFDAIVAFSGIERSLDSPLKALSTGMTLRLAFAVACHLERDILLVDEVLGVGDAGFQERCRERIRHLAAEGRTVLLISHDLGTIGQLCPRALRLDRGRLVAEGPARSVIDAYLVEAGQGEPAPTPAAGASGADLGPHAAPSIAGEPV